MNFLTVHFLTLPASGPPNWPAACAHIAQLTADGDSDCFLPCDFTDHPQLVDGFLAAPYDGPDGELIDELETAMPDLRQLLIHDAELLDLCITQAQQGQETTLCQLADGRFLCADFKNPAKGNDTVVPNPATNPYHAVSRLREVGALGVAGIQHSYS